MNLDARGFGMSQNDCQMYLAFMQACMQATEQTDSHWFNQHRGTFIQYQQRYSMKTGQGVQ